MADLITKIKKAKLLGRSGSLFPVHLKWLQVKNSSSKRKYVICNASEGEPEVKKDYYILKKHLKEVVGGIKLAQKELKAETAYIYLNKKYYREFKKRLFSLTKNFPIELFEKPEGYLAGEETVILNIIEGKRKEPREKPPFPTEKGLFGKPTLVNNVETFFQVYKISKGETLTRFYSIYGKAPNKGVFELENDLTIKQVLEKTSNYPEFYFLLQIGGGAAGEIITSKELNRPFNGLASIIVLEKDIDLKELMRKWASFFQKENCDKCAPCREGAFRIKEILEKKRLTKKDIKTLQDIFEALEQTSLCPLGRMIPKPFKSVLRLL